eukprot:3606179-Lingulodinium_polyedra.AAC.1
MAARIETFAFASQEQMTTIGLDAWTQMQTLPASMSTPVRHSVCVNVHARVAHMGMDIDTS